MLDSYVDYVIAPGLPKATDLANEQIERMSMGGWTMIQCQMCQNQYGYSYALVYQKTKEQIINKPSCSLNLEFPMQQF